MGASSPDPRYFKDGAGLHPRWRFFFKWPKKYLWMKSPSWFKSVRFAVQKRRRGR